MNTEPKSRISFNLCYILPRHQKNLVKLTLTNSEIDIILNLNSQYNSPVIIKPVIEM